MDEIQLIEIIEVSQKENQVICSRLDDTDAALADAYQQLENHRNTLRELIERM